MLEELQSKFCEFTQEKLVPEQIKLEEQELYNLYGKEANRRYFEQESD